VVLGGSAYAYTQKVWPFNINTTYTEQNLLSGILAKVQTINTSANFTSVALNVGPRDKDAVPFTIQLTNQDVLLKKYENDSKRAKDVRVILQSLRDVVIKGYPSTLVQLLVQLKKEETSFYFSSSLSFTDPMTSTSYSYALTENGANFSLQVTFETKDAISQIKNSYDFKESTTPINGQTVTFTKDSSSYIYVSAIPPKPFFVTLGDQATDLPNEFKVDATVSAKTDWQKADALADWIFNLDANGDFGDLQYKFNIDALKKDQDYFFKVNNIPSIFLGTYSNLKGEWIKINTSEMDSYIGDEISQIETSYKENRADFTNLLKASAQFADEEKLITFKNKPNKEKVNNKDLYRHDLQINRDAILPFYKKLVAEASKYKTAGSFFEDNGLVEYFQSKEFNDIFDYYQKNTSVIIWTDSSGYPAIIEYKLRIVPPDTAEQLKDKQANMIFTVTFSDINKPLEIEAPDSAKTIEDLLGSVLVDARNKGKNASIKANLSFIRTLAALYYDENNYSYGKSTLTGSCVIAGTLFTHKHVVGSITAIKTTLKDHPNSSVVCYGNPKAWAISVNLFDVATEENTYWCVDSSGTSKAVTKAITSTSCK